MKPMNVKVDPPIRDKMEPNFGMVKAVNSTRPMTTVLNTTRFQE